MTDEPRLPTPSPALSSEHDGDDDRSDDDRSDDGWSDDEAFGADEDDWSDGEIWDDDPTHAVPGAFGLDGVPIVDATDDGLSSAAGNHTLRRKKTGGVILGSALLGLREVLYGKPKEDAPIQVEASGDPPNIDLEGLDVLLGGEQRMIAPPLDEIKARGRTKRKRSGTRR